MDRLAACNTAVAGLSSLMLRGVPCKTSTLLQQTYPIAVPIVPDICFSDCFPVFMAALSNAQKVCQAGWSALVATDPDTARADQDAFLVSVRSAHFARLLYLANAGLLARVSCASNLNNVSCGYLATQYDTYLPQECPLRVRVPHPAYALIYGFDASEVIGSHDLILPYECLLNLCCFYANMHFSTTHPQRLSL
jgi:hypothetical protein